MIILDTNVISELMRLVPSDRVARWTAKHPSGELFTTCITEAEIHYGIELLENGKRRDALTARAGIMFATLFAGRVLNFDTEAAHCYASIAAQRQRAGKRIAYADAQIAAIARVRNATLATRNTTDFENCGIEVVDPWLAS